MGPKNFDEQLEYYKSRYDEVAVVYCEGCKAPIAFEVKGGVDNAGDQSHPDGRLVIPVSYPDSPLQMALLSWRARLDGQIGYECGNLVDNPKYAEAVKARDADHANHVKAIEANNNDLRKRYESYKTDYPKLKAAYDKAAKKGLEPGQSEPVEPTEPAYTPEPPVPPVVEPKQVLCKTSTILSDQERGRVPEATGGAVPAMAPFDRDQLANEIANSNTKPDVEIKGRVKRVEKFKIERVK